MLIVAHGQYSTFATAVVNLCLTLLHGCYTLVCVSGRGAPVVRKETVMDIYCRKCGEPWDNDELHEVAEEHGRTYDEVRELFARNGCAVFDTKCYVLEGDEVSVVGEAFAILAELGDWDGAMSEVADLRDLGVIR